MNSESQEFQLDEICEFVNGFAFKPESYIDKSPDTYEVFRMGYISRGGGFKEDSSPVFVSRSNPKLDKYRLRQGDIIIAMTDMKDKVAILGNTARVPEDNRFVLNQRAGLIRVSRPDIVCPVFLYYYSNWKPHVDYLRARANSGVQVNLSTSAIKEAKILLPSFLEQRLIGEILSSFDEQITLLRETNATLEAIAQALFKSWFVDFDPVRAKMEGRAPEGMDDATAALFPDSFEESELGLVPRGWDVSTVGRSFTLTMGQSPPGDTYNEIGEGLPFYQGRTDFGFRFPSQRVFCTAPTRLAEIGDTLVSVRAPVGDVNVALEPCALGRGVASVRSLNGYAGFTFYSIRSLKSYFELHDGEGTVFGSINKKDFESLPVIAPDNSVVYAFEGIVSVLDDSIKNNEQKLRALSDLRDTLLPRLISGQLRFSELNALLRETA